MGKIKKETAEGDSMIGSEQFKIERPTQEAAEGDHTIDSEKLKTEVLTYEEKLESVNVIAKPMASKRLTKKCYKLIKKATKQKTFVRNGLKDVQTRLRKGETGIVLFAGDVTPVDIMCHLPAVCEDRNIPYCYTPSRLDLGAALGVKRGSLMVLIREHEDYKDAFTECRDEINNLGVEL